MKLTLGQVADFIHAEGEFRSELEVEGYSIDSRTIGAGELFFAVRGERVDGHDFVQAALANGAVAAVVAMHWLAPAELDPCTLLRVPGQSAACEDCVLSAMQRLANAVRRVWGGRVIGVTGSAGKTTTKEAIAAVLGVRHRVLKSEGNLNNGFGLPLQLLKLEREHEVAVIEMGMNHAGEIAALAKIAEPNWAVVTNVAPVHLEHFADGIAGIAQAKYELVEALPPDGIAILNADDPYVASFARGLGDRAVMYGFDQSAKVRVKHIVDAGVDGTRFAVAAGDERAEIALSLLGQHNVLNAAAAIAVGLESGMTLDECAAGVSRLAAADRRGEVLYWHGATIINDSYNSNPRALDAMVDALLSVPAKRYVVIAGEMLELGPEAPTLHAQSGKRIAERGVGVLVGVRGHAEEMVAAAWSSGVEAIFVSSAEEAGAWMSRNLREGDAVLLKASRGVKLERALEALA